LAVHELSLTDYDTSSHLVELGGTIRAEYAINNPNSIAVSAGLGIEVRPSSNPSAVYSDDAHYTVISAAPGQKLYERDFTISPTLATGSYDVRWSIWDSQHHLIAESMWAPAALSIQSGPSGQNHSPVAVVSASNTNPSPGSLVSLDGSHSYDPDGGALSYSWVQTSGPSVNLVNAGSATPSFTAPAVGDQAAQLEFMLTVHDTQGLSGTSRILIFVQGSGQQATPFNLKSTIDGNTYNVYGTEINALPVGYTIDPGNKALHLSIDGGRQGGWIQVTIPKDVASDFKAIMNTGGGNEVISYTIVDEKETKTTLAFTLPSDSKQVDIMATNVVPEFPLSIIVMTISMSSIIVLVAAKKTR